MCVHNEAPFLHTNLAYHHAVGVQKAYLFLDRCTDQTEEIARSFPWVNVIHKNRTPDTKYSRQHQNLCSDHALNLARADHIDWLMHIDPDELAFGGQPSQLNGARLPYLARRLQNILGKSQARSQNALQRAQLPPMLASAKPETEVVSLPTKEAIPIAMDQVEQFWKNPYFQSHKALQREILDPVTGEKILMKKFLGHQLGKSIVRTAADVQAYNSHFWTRNQHIKQPAFPEKIDVPTEHLGCHYHYLLITPEQWRKKYRQYNGLATTWPNGMDIPFPKLAWRRASETMNADEIHNYLHQWVFIPVDRAKKLVAQGEIVAELDVHDIITTLNT